MAKLPRELWDECRSTAERKARALHYEDLCVLLLELALEKESEQHLNAYRPGGGGSGGRGKGLGGSSCMVKMRPRLPLYGTAKK